MYILSFIKCTIYKYLRLNMRDIDTLENRNIEISKYRKVIFKIPNLIFSAVASLAKVIKNVDFDNSLKKQRVSDHAILGVELSGRTTRRYYYPCPLP